METVNQIGLEAGQHVVFDNLFTPLPLLETLSAQGVGATGRLREDRLCEAPLMTEKSMEKKNRGYTEEVFTGCTSVVKWTDNKVLLQISSERIPFAKPRNGVGSTESTLRSTCQTL